MSRKYRLRIIQITLLIFGIFIIYYTYYKEKNFEKTIISTEKQKQIKKRIANQPEGSEVFSTLNMQVLICRVIDISLNLKKLLIIKIIKH